MALPARDGEPGSSNLDMSLFDAKRIEGESESYEILESIARGSNADLYLVARRGALGVDSLMVLKRMQESHARDSRAVDSFLQEARISVRLRHPNIVTTFGCGEDRDIPYLTMSISKRLASRHREAVQKKGCSPHARSRRVHRVRGPQRLASRAHAQGLRRHTALVRASRSQPAQRVRHVRRLGEAHRLRHFEERRCRAKKPRPGIVKGKCAYVAPEQVVGDPLDPRTDIFSLGVVLWELLTGRRLMNGTSTYEIMMRVLNRPSPAASTLVPDLPPGLDAIISKALSRDPNERFASADAMRKAIRAPGVTGDKPIASAEDLSRVMAVLFGADHAAKVESIQNKMATLGRGGRAHESGPVPRAARTSVSAAIPVPATSSVRLVRDRRTDEIKTINDGKKLPVRDTALDVVPVMHLEFDDEGDGKTKVEKDFHIPTAAIPEEFRNAFDSEDDDPEIEASSIRGLDRQRLAVDLRDRRPSRCPSASHHFRRPPSTPPPAPVETTGPMLTRATTLRRRFALFVTDVLVIALAATITVRAPLPHHGMKTLHEVRVESAHAMSSAYAYVSGATKHLVARVHH